MGLSWGLFEWKMDKLWKRGKPSPTSLFGPKSFSTHKLEAHTDWVHFALCMGKEEWAVVLAGWGLGHQIGKTEGVQNPLIIILTVSSGTGPYQM